eukprot:5093202-Prymnesium_polylepis.3
MSADDGQRLRRRRVGRNPRASGRAAAVATPARTPVAIACAARRERVRRPVHLAVSLAVLRL